GGGFLAHGLPPPAAAVAGHAAHVRRHVHSRRRLLPAPDAAGGSGPDDGRRRGAGVRLLLRQPGGLGLRLRRGDTAVAGRLAAALAHGARRLHLAVLYRRRLSEAPARRPRRPPSEPECRVTAAPIREPCDSGFWPGLLS